MCETFYTLSSGKLLSERELEACRQEPDWEPAEKLLERIKKEKTQIHKKDN
jgi:type I restriction enzyme, S subunit